MSRALAVGLTGGVASGKSRVAARLAVHGIPVEDADLVAREVVAPGAPALAEIAQVFGPRAIAADGTLDRAALRALVFADTDARRKLEAITHPRIRDTLRARAAAWDGPYGVLVVPLLAENHDHYRWLDVVVVVDAPDDARRARLVARDGIDAALADRMMAAQASRAQRLAIADEVVVNAGGLEALDREADALHARLLARARLHPPT